MASSQARAICSAAILKYITAIIFILLFLGTSVETAKILAIFSVPARSHVGAYQPLMEELARRGHEMTVVTPFPRTKPLENYNEIIIEDTFPSRDSSEMNLFEYGKNNFLFTMLMMSKIFVSSCEKLVNQPNIQKLIHSTDRSFDLIIYEPFGSQCIYGLLHKFKSPSIQFLPNTITPMLHDSMGNPSTSSYIPDALMEEDTVNFTTRFFTLLRYGFIHIFQLYIQSQMTSIMKKHFPDPSLPSITELETNASFLFLHSHPILNYPKPLTPNTIEVGGLHIKAAGNLPQDLKKYLDDAPEGVIYFSLGSNARSIDMPEAMRNAILKSFSKLKQKVLWKWEADTLPGQPKNVRLGKWLPQHDILAHPNVKLFITHGGLMSIQEATYFGVPMIAIPVMGDQKFNALHAQNNGYALVLEIRNITDKSLDWAINEILLSSSYRETAQKLSRIFQDDPQKPLDRAVFWTEYAIRHKGAPHLHSAALNLNFFQYFFLDVIAVISLLLLASITLLVFLSKMLLKKLFSKSKVVSKKKKTK
ncbi:hypothetical protein R5R35_006195 [Gryllus longicercus]|uniref:UDP-glucuronosyltransferase n=1 Tax=Gryllus longicercus TaxID=2509291 RepID=A0AAN9Z5F9_9ORTH